jgi:hypothetical protein
MKIEIPDKLISDIKTACHGYDIPESPKEIQQTIESILTKWIEDNQ